MIKERGGPLQTGSCRAGKPLSCTSFQNNRRPAPFSQTVGAGLSFNLPDFSSLSTENSRYCLPFFSGSQSDSNQTRQGIVPLLSKLLVKSGSDSLTYIALFCTAMGMLMWMCLLQTRALREPDKDPSLLKD